MAVDSEQDQLPEPSETIHLPGPSYLPVLVAAGTTVALIGVVVNMLFLVAGLLLTIGATVRWVRETRRDVAELPVEH